jgi:hypothetical protein
MARRNGNGRFVLAAAGLLALGLGLAAVAQVPKGPEAKLQTQPKAAAPDPSKVPVPFTTADGVDLVGTYYRGNKGKDSPCAIILHKFGSDRTKGELDALARELQRSPRGFAVLTFDFRGHGESKNVAPTFWAVGVNNSMVNTRGSDKSRIEFKDFRPSYFPWLVNDIMAARKFLELKNDGGECNVNSLFLIGAQEGASLGYLFATTEWDRTYTTGYKALQSAGTQHIAGNDIAGCVWLSLLQRPQVNTGSVTFDLNAWPRNRPLMREKTATLLIYGERDTAAKQTADNVYRALTSGREKASKFTQKYEVKGTELAGQALIGQTGLGVSAKVIEFTDRVLTERRAVPWASVAHDENPLRYVPNLGRMGFRGMP